jgi:DNA (cytosine-5)-methyltransferase 1
MTFAPDQLELELANGVKLDYEVDADTVVRTATLRQRSAIESQRSLVQPRETDAFAAWWSAFIRGERVQGVRGAERVRMVDLFSSVGGLSVGAMEAISAVGHSGLPLLAADIDKRALQVYKANLNPRQIVPESVRGLVDFRVAGGGEVARFAFEPTVADDRLRGLVGNVDLLLAGPPCQGHSSLNNHSRHDDPKNLLYLTVPAVAVALGARHVVIENVPNVVLDKHGVVQTTMALLRSAGYQISSGVLAADKFGWPQARKRFFMVASRDTSPLKFGVLNEVLAREPLPVSWLLRDLEDRPIDDADVMNSVPLMSPENRMRVNYLHDNDLHNLPNVIRPDCHREGTTYPATYGRMHGHLPAPTITGGFLTPGRGRFIHPTQRRVLTPREAARVQGFPDWFRFATNPAEPPARAEVSRWIGNAVPSLLGFAATLAALGGEADGS